MTAKMERQVLALPEEGSGTSNLNPFSELPAFLNAPLSLVRALSGGAAPRIGFEEQLAEQTCLTTEREGSVLCPKLLGGGGSAVPSAVP